MLGGKNSAVMFICLVETKCFNIVTLESVKGHPHLAILPAILLATVLLTHPH